MASQFVLLRLVKMRGVDLTVFDFDYDLTWAAFFMNADGFTYSRYGSREEGSAEKGLSLKGLKYTMQKSLSAYASQPTAKPKRPVKTADNFPARPELFPAGKRLKKDACIHCHQVHNFQTDLLWTAKKWSKKRMWFYPPTMNLGFQLDVDQGDKIKSVAVKSAAAKLGLKPGDVFTSVNGVTASSEADVRYGLHRAPESGSIPLRWTRNGQAIDGKISLKSGWRKSDISWRASMWTMPPAMGIYGKNLTVSEKRKFGLSAKRLAFRQGRYVPPRTRRAGFRTDDLIIGVNGKPLEMTMLQFNLYMRTNFNVGDKVSFDIIRGQRKMKISMTLPVRPNR